MKKCLKCGILNPDSVFVCGFCGERLGKAKAAGRILTFYALPAEARKITAEEPDDPASPGSLSLSLINGEVVLKKYCGRGGRMTVPEEVERIGDRAFEGSFGLTRVRMRGRVRSIGSGAFGGCASLKTVELPDSLTEIGDRAFCDCTSLTDIELPRSLTAIGNSAFRNCSSLGCVTIPRSVEKIGYDAFRVYYLTLRCYPGTAGERYARENGVRYELIYSDDLNAPAAYFDYEIAERDGRLIVENYKGSSAKIDIPRGVAEIGYYAFGGNSTLTEVNIPDTITVIGGSAFHKCKALESVTIPKSVTSIGKDVFFGCGKLTLRVYPGTEGEACAKRENRRYDLLK